MQVLVNGLLAAAITCMSGLGFALIYRTAGFFHFSYGATITAGAYFAFLFHQWLNFPLPISLLGAIAATAALGILLDGIIYRPLRVKQSTSLIATLASLGIYTVVHNLISLIFGDEIKSILQVTPASSLKLFGAAITPIQTGILASSILLTGTIIWWMKTSDLGKAMRALASDAMLARVCGIDSDRLIKWAFAIGSCLAGITGILIALDLDMTPTMGMSPMLMGMVAFMIGGLDRLVGVVLGALVLSFLQQLAVWLLGAQWQNAIAFIVLLGFLLFRPQGFLGRATQRTVRQTTV
ncbi:MAG: branched-chain amino acid ABC transporter permease [Symploca sp. SIO3E6]|nr:branched-chain amino acid ABC transporter permease [Caldora sp. SIO3E6]